MRLRKKQSGFTLIELMIVVAIIGILAVLAIFGVRKYLANSKTAEATNTIGQINHNSVAAYERESAPSELVVGKSSTSAVHVLCKSVSNPVPANMADVQNKKYTADPAPGKDYHSDPQDTGFNCLKFEMNEPQYYAYSYGTGNACPGLTLAANTPTNKNGWTVCANGDLNGDTIASKFSTGGEVQNGQAITYTQVQSEDPEE